MLKKRKVLLLFRLEKSLLENSEKVRLFYIQPLKHFIIFTANIQNMAKDRSATVFYTEMVAFWNEHSPHIQKKKKKILCL